MLCISYSACGLSPPHTPSTGSLSTYSDHPHQGLCELTHKGQIQGISPQNTTPSTHRSGTATAPCPENTWSLELPTADVFTSFAAANEAGHNYTQTRGVHNYTQCSSDFLQRWNYQRFLIWTLKLTLKGASLSSAWNPLHTAGNANDKNQK